MIRNKKMIMKDRKTDIQINRKLKELEITRFKNKLTDTLINYNSVYVIGNYITTKRDNKTKKNKRKD